MVDIDTCKRAYTLAGQFTRTLDILARSSALHSHKKAPFANTRSGLANVLLLGQSLGVFLSKLIPRTNKEGE